MTSRIIVAIAFALSVLSYGHASSEGIGKNTLDNYIISGFSRPCCTFGLDTIGTTFGLSGAVDKDNLGSHHFARENKQKDTVGIAYTCNAGFVDVSHLRDNADWSGHIYFNLPQWLGSGKKVFARNEGGFKSRAIFFPKVSAEDLSSLTEDDKEKLAVSIGFSLALLHEIPTSFNIAVSAPASLIVFEKASAFSVEDAFSNLLGNTLGAKAARSALPFNQAMTELLNSTLASFDARTKAETLEAFEITRNDWWVKGFSPSFKHILKRDFSHEVSVEPRRIENAPFCGNSEVHKLTIPDTLSNGKSVNDYYEIHGNMKKKLRRSIQKTGVTIDGDLTQKEYGEVIEAIEGQFVEKLGKRILN